mmetsp:Transcript_3599/g.13884  ORF Transcript_3599/g.13884 Transcript_3599/m.13884 type:complete len:201 (+) Transcript_3599:1525-2127(+)
MVLLRPFGGAVDKHFFASCVDHSDSHSSISLRKYILAFSLISCGIGIHSTTACIPPCPNFIAVSMKQQALPSCANILTKHFLKFLISSQTSSSTAREDCACAMGAMRQCPGTSRPCGGSIRYAKLPYATCRCFGLLGASIQNKHLLCSACARLKSRTACSFARACCFAPDHFLLRDSYISKPPSWSYSSSTSNSLPLYLL